MGTRPMVHRAEVARAIVMIARRRAKVDDRHRDLLPDSEDSDPREVLDYLRKFSGPDIPRWVLQAEVSDALTLTPPLRHPSPILGALGASHQRGDLDMGAECVGERGRNFDT